MGKLLLHIRPEPFESLVYEKKSKFSWSAIINEEQELLAWSGADKAELKSILTEIDLSRKYGIEQMEHGWILQDLSVSYGLFLILLMSKGRLYDEEHAISPATDCGKLYYKEEERLLSDQRMAEIITELAENMKLVW